MEVGAVKHQLNTEIILMKKTLNQAKVQIIHKLTRKAQTLKSQKKYPDHLRTKLQRKADTAIADVLLIKKVRPKDLIRFAITHKGKLVDFINKPTVNIEKVYAKILLHKAMQQKYKYLRQLYSNMPIDQLLMTRKERLELKKKNQERSKSQKSKKYEDEDDIDKFSADCGEDIAMQSDVANDGFESDEHNPRTKEKLAPKKKQDSNKIQNNKIEEDEHGIDKFRANNDEEIASQSDETDDGFEHESDQDNQPTKEKLVLKKNNQECQKSKIEGYKHDINNISADSDEEIAVQSDQSNDEFDEQHEFDQKPQDLSDDEDRISSESDRDAGVNTKSITSKRCDVISPSKSNETKKEIITKEKETSKLSKLNKIKSKKLIKTKNKPRKKEIIKEEPVQSEIVDSFFLTESGDHYMTLAETTAPNEVKEEHYRGNRKMRRAEQFGNPIRSFKKQAYNVNKSRKEFNSNKYEKPLLNAKKEFDSSSSISRNKSPVQQFKDFNSSKPSVSSANVMKPDVQSTEKLHPSWEAKKQKSGIVAFQGKKVVFS